MNALSASRTESSIRDWEDISAKQAVTWSLVLHLIVLLLCSVGFAFKSEPKQIVTPPPIMVEFAQMKPADKKAPEPEESQPVKAKPMAAKALAQPKALPKVEAPEPPVPPLEPVKKVEAPAAKPEIKPEAKPKPIQQKTVTAKSVIEDARKEKEEIVENPEEFTSVLKNLVGEEFSVTPDEMSEDELKETTVPNPVMTRDAQTLNVGEQEAILAQLAKCWNVVPGAIDAENLIVEVTMTMNPDATVQAATIKDTWRYKNDSFFRAAADSALRAVRNPACSPLKLPLNKYDLWKKITIRFDPKGMFL